VLKARHGVMVVLVGVVTACSGSATSGSAPTAQSGEHYPTAATAPANAVRFQTVQSARYKFTVAFPVLPKTTKVQQQDQCAIPEYIACAYNDTHSFDLTTQLKESDVTSSGAVANYCRVSDKAIAADTIWTNCSVGTDEYRVDVYPVPSAYSSIALLLAEAWYNCTETDPAKIGNVEGTVCYSDNGMNMTYMVIRHGSLYTLEANQQLASKFIATFHLT
jgi:hypothetical protein